MNPSSSPHFQGKSSLEHLVEARKKGKKASEEPHSADLSCLVSICWDEVKATSILLSIFLTLFPFWNASLTQKICFLSLFLFGYGLWSCIRVALLGWRKLGRMHLLIQQEKWEIENNREQEKEELRAMYAAKGFSGKILTEVVETLMADDHRLLETMLTDELGLELESMEHPLKMALGAFLGTFITSLLGIAAFFTSSYVVYGFCGLAIALSTWMVERKQSPLISHKIFWNLACLALINLAVYFAQTFIQQLNL